MRVKQAVAERIEALCKERGVSVNTLANQAGIPPSTIYSILNEKSKNPGVVTIHAICDGFGISIPEFFNADVFNGLEQEIK